MNKLWISTGLVSALIIYLCYLVWANPYLAAAHGNLNAVRLHILSGGDINGSPFFPALGSSTRTGVTLLHYAALGGRTRVARWLLGRGANIEAGTHLDALTPLHYAANERKPEVMRLLLEHGADVNARDKDGRTPLLLAIDPERMQGKLERYTYTTDRERELTIELLLERGADPAVADKFGRNAMMRAASRRNLELMKKLLDLGVNARAATGGHSPENAITHLLNSNVHDPERERMEPLVLQWLLEHMLVNENGGKNHSLLHVNCDPRVLPTLIERGLDVNARNESGDTPLHAAAKRPVDCPLESLQILVDAGADVMARNREGEIPLHGAVRAFTPGKVGFILERTRDLNAADKAGNTALHVLAGRGYRDREEYWELLLAARLDPSALNKEGDTPLHILLREFVEAASKNRLRSCAVAELLLKAGANPGLKNRAGQTPRQLLAQLPGCGELAVTATD